MNETESTRMWPDSGEPASEAQEAPEEETPEFRALFIEWCFSLPESRYAGH